MRNVARWKHWDVVSLVSGGAPLVIFLILFYGWSDLAGFADELLLASLFVYFASVILAWRHGDGRLIAAGCAMLIIVPVVMLPVLVGAAGLLYSCFRGDCL